MSDQPRPVDDRKDQDWDVYTILVDEYRFQVTLNWQRSQYLLALNLGLVGAGTGLLGINSATARGLTSGLFLVGVLVAGASIRAITLQHEYYRETRERKSALEDRLQLGSKAPRPTAGMRGETRGPRLSPQGWSVNDLLRILLALLAVLDMLAAGATFATIDDLTR